MSALKGKKLLVMGGTRISCEIIRAAQRMGIYTVVADYNKIEDSPGKQIADESFMVDVTDVKAMTELVHREKVDGIITGFSDTLLPYYADICKATGLPAYGTREQFELFTDKRKYKALCRKFGVPTVNEYRIDINDLDNCIREITLPVIVKPSDSSGARGITVCKNAQELKQACSKAADMSKCNSVLVEPYLTGKEATVFWVFQDSNYHLSGIGNRHVKNNQEGVIPLPIGYTFPAAVTEEYIKSTADRARDMFRSTGLRNGMLFMQTKVENGVCIVYDIGYRLTGSLEYKLFKATCGYDPMEMLIHFALTGRMADEDITAKVNPYLGTYAYNVSYLAKPGKIAYYKGASDVLKIPGVVDAVMEHYPGEEITEKMKGLLAQISLRVLGTAPTLEELRERLLQLQAAVSIISDQGTELLLPGFEEEEMDDVIKDVAKCYRAI